MRHETYEILQNDGITPVGNIMTSGLFVGGPTLPGLPIADQDMAIVGGTGAFFGARGQKGQISGGLMGAGINNRNASITEDPANRRQNGGGHVLSGFYLIPLFRPEIATTPEGPAVFHADFSLVTAAKPAVAGEVLIVKAAGLGPRVPGVSPGQPFPSDPPPTVNSPVDVTVNGQPAEVINKIGWPGQVDTYRVDFRFPDGATGSQVSLQLTSAWIAGLAVSVPVQ